MARAIGAEIKPYDQNKIKVVTADGKEVKDLLGFAEVDVILGNQKLEKMKTLVFKNATNPCLVGRDVLATHPDIKQHFEAIMGKQTTTIKQKVPTENNCKTSHHDRSSDDDYDEMDDKHNDNSAAKGCWSKYKTKIDGDSINTKVPVNMDRSVCKTKINNSMEKRTSTIESVYNCNNDHNCKTNCDEINAIECPESDDEQAILICGIDLIIEDHEMLNSSLITSDESMVMSPNKSTQSKRRDRKLGISQCITPTWKKVNEHSSIMTSDRSQRTDITSPDIPSKSSKWSIEEQYQTTPRIITNARQTSTPERPPGPLLEEKSENILNTTNIAEEEETSWSEASQRRLLESERQGMVHKKYKQIEPLDESPNSSWGELAQRRLFESELQGKSHKRNRESQPSTPERPPGPSLEERETPRAHQWIKIAEQPSTPERPPGPSLEEKLTPKGDEKTSPIFKNVGFVNRKWTEIVVEDEEECEQLERNKVKEAIIQLSQRELHNPIDEWRDKCIRIKHKTYVPVEVNKDRNGRMIYTPLKPTNTPEISFGAELRTEKESEDDDCTDEDEITEVEYPRVIKTKTRAQNPDIRVKVEVEIKSEPGHSNRDNMRQTYRSVLTKQELISLISDEIKLDEQQSINLVDIINNAALSEHANVEQNDWDKRADEIRSELKRVCIEIESKGLAECRQTDVTSHRIEMTDNKPIRHKVRPVPYHCRKEFEQIIKDQLQAGIIRPSTSATCSPVNLVLKEDGSLRLTIDYRKVNNATLPDPYPLPRIDDIIARLAKNKFFSKIDLANGYYQIKMHKDSIKFTTFISEFGKHEYLAMPMGLKNAGSTFQRMMDKVLDGLIGEICYVYLDDIIIFSEDLEGHEGRVKQVLDRLKSNGLQIKIKKCEFIKPSIRFLGHLISHGQVEKSKHLVEAIASAELPKTMRQLRGFMGLANYYRKFIKGFAKIASPLNKHLNNTDKDVLLTDDAREAFETLKTELTDMDNILSLPDFEIPFILETDASDDCIGAALMQ